MCWIFILLHDDNRSFWVCAGDEDLRLECPDIELSSVDGKDNDSFSDTVAAAKNNKLYLSIMPISSIQNRTK